MPVARKLKPWRGFPNANVVHGIRARVVNTAVGATPGYGEVALSATGASGSQHIGTIPAGAVVVGITQQVQQVFNGTAPTLSIGTTAGGAELSALAAVTAQGTTERTIVTTWQMPTADTPLYVSLGGTPDFTGTGTGKVEIVVRYYMNKD